MKRLIYIIMLTVISVACTQNGGNIGDWFGTWRLDAIEIDGTPDESYAEDLLWKFQSDIIQMVQTNDKTHIVDYRWGTWTETDNTLVLNFSHVNNHPDGTTDTKKYIPFEATYLPYGVSSLKVIILTRKSLVLKYISKDSVEYTYYFTKW